MNLPLHTTLDDARVTASRDRHEPADAALPRWLTRVGLLNDYVRVPFANGSSFASQFLFREFRARGAEVEVVGPHDPDARRDDLPERHVALRSLPLRTHPGVHLAFPSASGLRELRARRYDLVLGQTCNALMDAGVYLRAHDGVPLVMVNTVHLPSVYNAVLPDAWLEQRGIQRAFEQGLVPLAERNTADAYNRGDGLVVLSPGMRAYWRGLGVEVPIHVIPRAIEPKIFGRAATRDPFDPSSTRGGRLLVVCRHVREKGVGRLLEILARHVFPHHPASTLTLVGDGPDHARFRDVARRLGIESRCSFHGEQPLESMPDYYGHADLFVYTSLSETYGQVVSEALYAGVPVVAFRDGMGVSGQVTHGRDGLLVDPAAGDADEAFGASVIALLDDPSRRAAASEQARALARLRCDPRVCVARYVEAFEEARAHRDRTFRPNALLPGDVGPLVRWAGMHALVAGLGLLRPPTHHPAAVATPTWTLGKAS